MKLLLDSCALIWMLQGENIKPKIAEDIEERMQKGEAVYLSPISSWELGMLIARGKLSFAVQDWWQKVVDSGVVLADMPPEVLIASSSLSGTPPNDPSDRIIISTARAYDMQIVTRDSEILAYAKQGHVRALAC